MSIYLRLASFGRVLLVDFFGFWRLLRSSFVVGFLLDTATGFESTPGLNDVL